MVKIEELVQVEKEGYCDQYENHCIKQYEIYVGLMDKTSERRIECNKYFISLNSLLVSLIGIANFSGFFPNIRIIWLIITTLFGGVLNIIWIAMLTSYSNLNEARFHIIHLIEEKLPLLIFKKEWDYVNTEQKQKYSLLSKEEKNVPLLFIGLYGLLIIIGLYQLYCNS
ncbi:MAG: RipA family octameric membrane protein [Candidatus Helarchaeota archaeon]